MGSGWTGLGLPLQAAIPRLPGQWLPGTGFGQRPEVGGKKRLGCIYPSLSKSLPATCPLCCSFPWVTPAAGLWYPLLLSLSLQQALVVANFWVLHHPLGFSACPSLAQSTPCSQFFLLMYLCYIVLVSWWTLVQRATSSNVVLDRTQI